MGKIRFIGDVHQRYEGYFPLLWDVEYSIQVGDLGLDYTYLTRNLDVSRRSLRYGASGVFGRLWVARGPRISADILLPWRMEYRSGVS